MQTSAELPGSTRYSEHEIKIIQGTYEAIARLGTQQLSLRGIARELDVSPSLLTYHFGTHEKLVLETIRWVLEGNVRRIRAQVAAVSDPEETLGALMDGIFVSPQHNRDTQLVYLDLVQYSIRHAAFTGLSDLLRTYMNGIYAEVIETGVEAGVFHVDDIDLAARHARAIVEGSVLQWLQDDDWQETHTALRSECHRALLTLLRHSDRPKRRPRR